MLARQHKKASTDYGRLRKLARAALVAKGWSIRRAATILERDYIHLCRMLNGQRISEDLLCRVLDLPQSPVPRGQHGFKSAA